MADTNKFEQMLEKLVNEDKAGAEELFHEIVVEKSRDIYEGLLEADLEVDETDDEEVDESNDEEVDESDEEVDESDDDKELDEDFNLDEFEVEADPMDAMMGDMEVDGGDEAPAMDMDMDMGGEEGEGDVEDRVEDLEDALDELKAEFEKMMSGDDGDEDGEEAGDMDIDMDMDDNGDDDEEAEEAFAFETSDEEVDEASDEETDESAKSEAETMREYVEKVSAKMGDNGVNNTSTVAKPNHMGDGTASNLVQGGEADTKGTTGGLAANTSKEDNAGNVNVPGGKASKSLKGTKGHGAEKKGAGETADNKKSTVGK
jgi:hypothetical protein